MLVNGAKRRVVAAEKELCLGPDRDLVNRIADLDQIWFDAKASYNSGQVTPMNPLERGISTSGASADSHYRSETEYYLHVERGRAAVRNHGLVESGINRLIANLRLDAF